MVVLTISVTAQSNMRRELLSACRLIVDQTNRQKGCLGCSIFQNIDDEKVIRIEVIWKHRSHLDDHLHSDIFSALLGAVELLGETHEVRITNGSQSKGMRAAK